MFFLGAEVCLAALDIPRSKLLALCLQDEHTQRPSKEQVKGLQGRVKFFYTAVFFCNFRIYYHKLA